MDDYLYQRDPDDVRLEKEMNSHLCDHWEGELRVSVRDSHVRISGAVPNYDTKRDVISYMERFGYDYILINDIRVIGKGSAGDSSKPDR